MVYTNTQGVILKDKNKLAMFLVAIGFAIFATIGMILPTRAASLGPIDFEEPTYDLGTIHNQEGWSSTGAAGLAGASHEFDHEVAENSLYSTMSDQSLRISNAVTSGSFGDHTISPSLGEAAGESGAESGGLSAAPTSNYFEATFDFASVTQDVQDGLWLNVSPDRGDGARMSYVGLTDSSDGMDVVFYDFQTGSGDPSVCGDDEFVLTPVVEDLDRSQPHTVKIQMWFEDGAGNDVVTVTVDDTFSHTGTSWEDYFRDCEGNETRTVDSLIFLTRGTAAPGTEGNGFFIDNVSLTTEETDNTAPVVNIDAPADGEEVSGLVDIVGDVTDNLGLSHYNLSLYPGAVDLSDGETHPGDRITAGWCSGTVNVSGTGFENEVLCDDWDTTQYADGEYQIRLAARDAAGNRDITNAETGGDSSVHVITIVIDNDVDDKNDCKNGNWVLGVGDVEFRNQGDCVSYFASENQQENNPDGNRNENGARRR